MRFSITHPNPQMVVIHIGKRMVDRIYLFESPSYDMDNQPEFVRHLFMVEGVTRVTLSPYEISVGKAEVFSWEELLDTVLSVIKNCLSPTDDLEKMREDIHMPPPPPENTYSQWEY